MGAEVMKLGAAAARTVAPEAVAVAAEMAEAAAGNLLRETLPSNTSKALIPMFRNQEYLTQQGVKLALSVPTEEAISMGSFDLVESTLKNNRAKLTQVLSDNWNDVPLAGFHGATADGAAFMRANRTARSVYGSGASIDVGTIESKSLNPAELLSDLEKAGGGASAYVFKRWLPVAEKPGSMFVFRMPERLTPPKLIEYAGQKSLPFGTMGDNWAGSAPLAEWIAPTKYAGRGFARFNPGMYDKMLVGSIESHELEAMGFNRHFIPAAGYGEGGDYTLFARQNMHSVNANQQLMTRTMELLGFLKKM
jgi:hypothetical protein